MALSDSGVKNGIVTIVMATNLVPPTNLDAKKFYESIYDMVMGMLLVAQVQPGTFAASPGGGPIAGFGGPIS